MSQADRAPTNSSGLAGSGDLSLRGAGGREKSEASGNDMVVSNVCRTIKACSRSHLDCKETLVIIWSMDMSKRRRFEKSKIDSRIACDTRRYVEYRQIPQ